MEFFVDPHYRFMRYRRVWIGISIAVLVLGWALALLRGGVNVGIDFAGGTQLTVKFAERPEVNALRDLLQNAGFQAAQIQRFGDPQENAVLIKTPTQEGQEEGSQAALVAALETAFQESPQQFSLNQRGTESLLNLLVRLDPEQVGAASQAATRSHYRPVAEAIGEARTARGIFTSWEQLAGLPEVSPEVVQELQQNSRLGEFAVLGASHVGPQVGEELRRKGILAVVFSLFGMLAYIWYRFELRFGVGAVVAVLHDVLVMVPLFALTGYEFNLTTVAAFLTLVGYSVNDTVVVFDRVRENMRRNPREPFESVLNAAINETLSRTVLTGGTTLLAMGSLLFWGGDVLRGFAFILTVGIVLGTFSSIYVASPITLWWDQHFGRGARSARREQRKAA